MGEKAKKNIIKQMCQAKIVFNYYILLKIIFCDTYVWSTMLYNGGWVLKTTGKNRSFWGVIP